MGKFPKTLTAAEAGSKSLFKLADALLEETEVYGRGDDGLKQAQAELMEQGHVFALDRLLYMRRTAKWVSENVRVNPDIRWLSVSYTVHEDAAGYSKSNKLPVLFDWYVFAGLVQEKVDNGFITDHEGERLPPTKSGRETSGTRLTQNELRLYVEKEPNIPRTDMDVIAADEERLAEEIHNSSNETVASVEIAVTEELVDRQPVIDSPVEVMAASTVIKKISQAFLESQSAIDRARRTLEEAVIDGVVFDPFEWRGLADLPNSFIEPRLVEWRKTVGTVQTEEITA